MIFNFLTPKNLIVLTLIIFFFSCKNNPFDIDTSNIKLELKTKHFENDLFDVKKNNVDNLRKEYGIFFQDFTEQIIRVGSIDLPSATYHLNQFITDPEILKIKKDVDLLYSDFSSHKDQLELAFKRYKYYFPKKTIPEIITYISGFNYAVVTDVNYLGIGLDMFLGKDYKTYDQLGIPKYKSNSFSKQYIVTNAMLGWISTEFEIHESQTNLLEEMIHQGKLMYLLNALLPNERDYIKISFLPEQIKWCNNNEKQVWFHLVDNNLLYSKENSEIIKFMGESPFIQGFPEGAPGRIGHWQGWQIVKAYMKNNPKISMEQLMNEKNAQKILNNSKYKP